MYLEVTIANANFCQLRHITAMFPAQQIFELESVPYWMELVVTGGPHSTLL